MKHTDEYGLNIIEDSDPLDCEPINENTKSLEELIKNNSDDISAIEDIVSDELKLINKKLKNAEIKIIEELSNFDGYVVGDYYKVKNIGEVNVDVTDPFYTKTLAPNEEYTVNVNVNNVEFRLEISATSNIELTYFQTVKRYVDEHIDVLDTYTKNQIEALLMFKVDKVSGKGLSTNDFTDDLKAKLDEIDISNKITTPQTASVGQVLTVKAIDETGKPTEWECVSGGSGGGEVVTVYKPSEKTLKMTYNRPSSTSKKYTATGSVLDDSNDSYIVWGLYSDSSYKMYLMTIGTDSTVKYSAISFDSVTQNLNRYTSVISSGYIFLQVPKEVVKEFNMVFEVI